MRRSTENTMNKRKRTKGQAMIYKILHRKLKIERHQTGELLTSLICIPRNIVVVLEHVGCFQKLNKKSLHTLHYRLLSIRLFVSYMYINNNLVMAMVLNATLSNIVVISWRSVVMVEKTGVPGENPLVT